MQQIYEQQFGAKSEINDQIETKIDLKDRKPLKDEQIIQTEVIENNRSSFSIVAKLSQKLKTINTSNNSLSKEAFTDQAGNSSNSNQNSNQGYNQSAASASENYIKQKSTNGSSKQRQKSKSENRARKALRTISFILGKYFVIGFLFYNSFEAK